MTDSLDRLAQKLAILHMENRNPPSTAPRIGKVIHVEPLEVQWGSNIILKADKLLVPQGLNFQIGDKVTLLPDENLKMFFVMNILA